jgi:hypothetical protein
MAKKRTPRMSELQVAARDQGLYVATYSPGDGVTRYRFFDKPGNDYFGPQNGICTVLGLKAAHRYVHSGQCPISRRRRR